MNMAGERERARERERESNELEKPHQKKYS